MWPVVSASLLACAALFGVWFVGVQAKRNAFDVLEDLRDQDEIIRDAARERTDLAQEDNPDDGAAVVDVHGFYSKAQLRAFKLRIRIIQISIVLAILILQLSLGVRPGPSLIPGLVGALGFVTILSTRLIERRKVNFRKSIEFHLPLVMERLTMAVQAGHDIISGVRTIIEVETTRSIFKRGDEEITLDPVTRLFSMAYRITVAGMPFDRALNLVSKSIDCPALKHAFIHLALAHKEGGELITPLKELSDATQSYYQETVEEEIAKLPVKATAPLVCAFFGVLLVIICIPLAQISSFAGKVTTSMGATEGAK